MATATLADVMSKAIKRSISNIHTVLPGMIEKYDHKTQKAQVKPLIKKKYRDGVVESLPVIVDVPVVWPRSSNASMTFPVNKGDYVLLLFAERSIERFLASGGEQEPGDMRKYDLTDAIAIPGLYPFSEASRSDNNEDVLLIYNDTSVRITKAGNLEAKVSKDMVINVEKNSEVKIKGNSKVEIEGNSEVNIKGESTLSIDSKASVTIKGNVTVDVDGNLDMSVSGTLNITAPTTNIDGDLNVSGTVNLGEGGPAIARLGDAVEVTVNVTSGSSAGSYQGTGTITAGGGNTST